MSHQRSRVGFNWVGAWATVVLVITVAQVLLLLIPNEDDYWFWYHTSTDILELAFALALFSATSYTKVIQKLALGGLVVWQFYCMTSQLITDYFIDQISDDYLATVFITVMLVISWLMRFSLHWQPNPTLDLYGKFYEVIGRPSNLMQLGVAMYTGRGGSFAITNGVDLWCYSRQEGCMIRKKLNPGYMVNKMSVEICAATADKYAELNLMVGRSFSPLHNCLELQSLARRWS